jgi:HD-GYP domain-containing protein (c-di-GMP phosphodiesterase class II)
MQKGKFFPIIIPMIVLCLALAGSSLLFIFLFYRERRLCANEDDRLRELDRNLEESRQGYHAYARIGKGVNRGAGEYALLEMILDECQRLTRADGGTLYLYDHKEETLTFTIMHTDSRHVRQGGTSGNEIKLPPVPLYIGGEANRTNVCSSCAVSGEIINIPDVYKAEGFNFSGTRKYDRDNGYRSHSMLVMPMRDLEGKLLGVIQLINSTDESTGNTVSFSKNHEDLLSLLTAHAASTLNNLQLNKQLKELFDAFIKSIASTIDEKSPYTGEHIDRVVKLTKMITQAVNDASEGPYADFSFTREEVEEIHMSAWLHDIGKLTTPDGLVNKATKLELFEDRIELIETRFRLIEEMTEGEEAKALVREERDFVKSCNSPGESMDAGQLERLKALAGKTWILDGREYPYLEEGEVEKLSIQRGTLTGEERKLIENHVAMTYTILKKLPFPEHLSQVPNYASMHHEKLDGSGYFLGLKGDKIPLQARILAVADIFEALTAKDRPYRQPIGWDRALDIIKDMADKSELDRDIYELLLSSGVARNYSRDELKENRDN